MKQFYIVAFFLICFFYLTYGRQDQVTTSKQKSPEKFNFQTSCKNVKIEKYDDGIIMSGYLNAGIAHSKSALGFTFYGAQGVALGNIWRVPTVFWLNGGPGSSSQYGNFFEIGPLKIKVTNKKPAGENSQNDKEEFNFEKNKFSWNKYYNLVFVDQPVGTGVSYADVQKDIPSSYTTLVDNFYYALKELYFSQNGCFYKMNMEKSPMFMYGQSYAGKYIPSIASRIIEKGNKFNLKGIGLGNAFTSPKDTLESINEFAFKNNLISIIQFQLNKKIVNQGVENIKNKKWKDAQIQFSLLIEKCNPKKKDVYNIKRDRLPDSSSLEKLMNSEYGKNLFGFRQKKKYLISNKYVYDALFLDKMQQYAVNQVEFLLKTGIQVVVFSGDLDLMVPYQAPLNWMKNLNWKQATNFNSEKLVEWKEQSGVQGQYKSFNNLLFFRVYQAGHMVPQDKPQAALYLIKRAVDNALDKKNKK